MTIYLVNAFYGSDGCFMSWRCKAFMYEEDATKFIELLEIQLLLLYDRNIEQRRQSGWEKKYCQEEYYEYLEPGFSYARNELDISFDIEEIELAL